MQARQAATAPAAGPRVDVDAAAFAVVAGASRADADAGRLGAVEAEQGQEDQLRVREAAELALRQPGEEDAGRRAVLCLAAELAARGAAAAPEVDDHTASHRTTLRSPPA